MSSSKEETTCMKYVEDVVDVLLYDLYNPNNLCIF